MDRTIALLLKVIHVIGNKDQGKMSTFLVSLYLIIPKVSLVLVYNKTFKLPIIVFLFLAFHSSILKCRATKVKPSNPVIFYAKMILSGPQTVTRHYMSGHGYPWNFLIPSYTYWNHFCSTSEPDFNSNSSGI